MTASTFPCSIGGIAMSHGIQCSCPLFPPLYDRLVPSFWSCRAQEIKWAPWISFQFYFFFSSFLVPSFSWILVSPHLGHLTAVEAKHIGRRHMGICIHIPYISTATPPLSDRPFRCQWQASVCIEMCAFKMHSDSFWFPLLWEKLFNDCMTL